MMGMKGMERLIQMINRKSTVLFIILFSLITAPFVSANPLVGKMYDYESIGESFCDQLDQVLSFEGRLQAIKSNKLAFLSDKQIDEVNRTLTKLRHIKQIHGSRDQANFYVLGRDIVDSSLMDNHCSVRNVLLTTTQTIQISCKGLGYELDGENLFSEYEYSNFFLTTKQNNGEVVISAYVDGRLSRLKQQITVVDDDISRVYAPILQENQRVFKTPKS
ncbi:hypothetical protein C942_03507 [Photobacterium marinum]|uniref:Uncharacterized protein n=2 Tax=Photobacterium marinum TaxID=1056511 RepID=L8J409_9GAMM|nr:hypothetical protein C942_03507 [Photobacterium marinum]